MYGMINNWKRLMVICVLSAFIGGMLITTGGYLLANNLVLFKGNPVSASLSLKKPGEADAALAFGPDTIADIVNTAAPAVVKIDVFKTINGVNMDPFFNDPFFRQFFGMPGLPPEQAKREEHGIGSGFVISQDGYILTNEHVIDNAQKIEVTIRDTDKPFPAKVIGSDYDLDLAILKIDAGKPLSILKLGDSDKTRIGDWVVAIGNPSGLDHTVTVGVLSAKGRPVQIGNRSYRDLIQTDAAINPGNSGGPLLNLQGEVVGINTAVALNAQGIGFAIPSKTASAIIEDLIKNGRVIHPWLGVEVRPLNKEMVSHLGLENADGSFVATVAPGSPAEKAGIQQGDVILALDDNKIKNPDDLVNLVANTKIGQQAVLLFFRQGQPERKTLMIEGKPFR